MYKALAAATLLFALAVFAQEGMLQPVPLPEAKALRARINRKLLPPPVSHLEVEPKQTFRLVSPGQIDLLLVPVTFWGDSYHSRCGIFAIPTNADPQTYIPTITGDEDLAITQCGNLIAVRRTPHDGPHPQLRLTYRTFDPPQHEDTADILLRWNPKTATYYRAKVIPGK